MENVNLHNNVEIFILEFIRSVVNLEFTERIDSLISVSDNKQRNGQKDQDRSISRRE